MHRAPFTSTAARLETVQRRICDWIAPLACALAMLSGCIASSTRSTSQPASDRASNKSREFPLDSLPTSTVTVNGHVLRVWLALDVPRQSEGLMFVPSSEIDDDQGMLFVFPDERMLGFWMLNTIAPLDIAYARFDGTIVKIWQMPPQTLQTFPSIEPAMFALELKQGTLARLGVKEGDRLTIPSDVFKTTP
ncbi:hypothetical protein RAS1_18980 [Phycisphaerae bacterium RAS1]|nr:hypothetical protein RAS1_18980 [Phycisphaerae bacterium RAS1]